MDTEWCVVERIEAWREFKNVIHAGLEADWGTTPGRWVFRGHADADWRLVASLDRELRGLPASAIVLIQTAMASSAQERLKVQGLIEPTAALDDGQIGAILQHEGAPTRLLDWTLSPYIAAFFALSSARSFAETNDGDVAIFMLDTHAEALKADQGLSLERSSSMWNARADSQMGVFTLNRSPHHSVEEFLEAFYATRPDEPCLRKVVLPRSESVLALRDLELMGLSSESLFPGAYGIARYAFYRALEANS